MSAKSSPGPRSPENISAGVLRIRVVATSISTLLMPGAVTATGSRSPRGRAQPATPIIRAAPRTHSHIPVRHRHGLNCRMRPLVPACSKATTASKQRQDIAKTRNSLGAWPAMRWILIFKSQYYQCLTETDAIPGETPAANFSGPSSFSPQKFSRKRSIRHSLYALRRARPARTAGSTSSVHTLKVWKFAKGGRERNIGRVPATRDGDTSNAGHVVGASKVNQRPSRKTSNHAL